MLVSNFSHAFPSWGINRIRSSARQSAARMMEMGFFSLIYPAMDPHRRRHTLLIDESSESLLRDLTKKDTPVLFLLPHVCLFESLAASPLFRPGEGKSIGAIYRPNRNPNLDKWIQQARLSSGIKIFSRKEGLKKAMYFLRNKNWLTILFDQNGGESGADTYFLNRLTSITTLPDIFRYTKNLRVIYANPKRISFLKSKLYMEEIFSEKEHSIAHAAHEILARDVRSCPFGFPEWLWSHGKWKTHFYPKVRFNLNSKRSFLDKDDNSHTGTRILIRLPNWLGDVVMALPIIRSLREARRDMFFIVLGLSIFREVIESFKLCEEYVSLNKDDVTKYVSTLIKMRYRYPECQVLFTNSQRGDIESIVIGAQQRFGLEIGRKKRWALTDKLRIKKNEFYSVHQTKSWEKLICNFGYNGNISLEPFKISQMQSEGDDRRRIGVAIGSSNNPSKQWPLRNWAEFLLLLRSKYPDSEIGLYGTSSDAIIAKEITTRCKDANIQDYVGKTTLSELLKHFSCCKIIVGCDSGAVHLANAVGISTLTIFGPTNHTVTSPVFNTEKKELVKPLNAEHSMKDWHPIEVFEYYEKLNALLDHS